MNQAHSFNKTFIGTLSKAMYDFDEKPVRQVLENILAKDAVVRMAHPFGDVVGAKQWYETGYKPLFQALPDLERREYIAISGTSQNDRLWVGCAGYYTGTFLESWLDIPPTGHQVHMRFHEFFRIEDGQVREVHCLWDIPEVMMQAGCWPMVPSLGREWNTPAPATLDGLDDEGCDPDLSAASLHTVIDMLNHMQRHPKEGGAEVMEMEKFWHPRMNWYGPAGIGTARGISGFRHWHQIPFLNAMPDRGQHAEKTSADFFAQNNYVAVTGWPNMMQTHSASGWLGLPPTKKLITLRSLDFWRIENGLIRENWVLVDLLDVYHQLGVDVFGRLKEFNKARNTSAIPILQGAA